MRGLWHETKDGFFSLLHVVIEIYWASFEAQKIQMSAWENSMG